jgi:hypothetical protein
VTSDGGAIRVRPGSATLASFVEDW